MYCDREKLQRQRGRLALYMGLRIKKGGSTTRVNTFAHVNHSAADPRLGVLLCINGTGILNAWTRRLLGDLSYVEMNEKAASVAAGSEGLSVLPFGNGAEDFNNKNIGAHMVGLDLNRHDRGHLCRAVQEGIVFSFMYGMEIMADTGMPIHTIRAGDANMFMSPIFSQSLANISAAQIELYDTDGALGAARGAGVTRLYESLEEAFFTLEKKQTIEPDETNLTEAYGRWKHTLEKE